MGIILIPLLQDGCNAPAVARVRHVEFSEQTDNCKGRASARDIIDLLLLLNLGILGTGETVTLIFNETSAKKRTDEKLPPTCEMS